MLNDWVKDVLIILAFGFILAQAREANAAEPNETALWLARSCVGEAGWQAHETGECAAIWHVYKKRTFNRRTVLEVAFKYSAAIKRCKGHSNRWIFYLSETHEKPLHWPRNAKWHKYQENWQKTLEAAILFVSGHIPDPLPAALHYGSPINVPPARYKRLKAPEFRNRFYTVKGVKL